MTAGARLVSLILLQPVTATANNASAAAWRGFMRSVYQNAESRNSDSIKRETRDGFHTSFGRVDPCTQG